MITGDHILIAKETCRRLGIGENILSAEHLPMLHPETKVKPCDLKNTHGEIILNADGFAQVRFTKFSLMIITSSLKSATTRREYS